MLKWGFMYLDSLTRTEEHKIILCFALKILSFILNLKKNT